MLDGEEVHLQLDRLSGQASPGNAGLPGLFIVTRGSRELALGRFINFSLPLPAVEDVVELPYESIYGADRIYRYEDGVMMPITIERVGEIKQENGVTAVLVRSDQIRAGDKIITTQVPNAIAGRKVRLGTPQVGE